MKVNMFPLLALALLLVQCHKSDPDPAKPEDQLPAATQTGANTFGCLVNGQPYTPSGNNGTSNYAVIYDPTFQGGNLQVETYRYLVDGTGTKYKQSILLGGSSISKVGNYTLLPNGVQKVFFMDYSRSNPCKEYASDNGIYTSGTLTITRLDQQAGIIAGTFSFTLAQPGCDTIKVTQGRFDKKL